MTTPLPIADVELEALGEKVREFLRVSRPIPIVIVETREPDSRNDRSTSRHRIALAQIESCCLVPGRAWALAEELVPFGVSYLHCVELDRDLVLPTDASIPLTTHFGGPDRLRPLPRGGIRVASADSSWPWGHLLCVSRVNLEACREDAENLVKHLEQRDRAERKEHEELKPEKDPRRGTKHAKHSTSAQEDRMKLLTAIRDGRKNWAEVAMALKRNASSVRKIGARLIKDGLVRKQGNTKNVRMVLTPTGRRAVEGKR